MSNSTIYIRNLRLAGRHGVLPQERAVGACFIINICVAADISEAVATDNLSSTISYADVVEVVREQMAVPSTLIEHVAGRIAKAILLRFPAAKAVDVDIMKQNPPMGADCSGAGVALRLERADL